MGSGHIRSGGDLLERRKRHRIRPVSSDQCPLRAESALDRHSDGIRGTQGEKRPGFPGRFSPCVLDSGPFATSSTSQPSLVFKSRLLGLSEARHMTIQMHSASNQAPAWTCYDDLGTTETTRISFGQRFGTARFFASAREPCLSARAGIRPLPFVRGVAPLSG